MIKPISYHQLDFNKYTQCIRASAQYHCQAELRCLEVANGTNWDFLIYEDYQAVMPIPLKKKWIFTYVVMPPYIQQLGVFSAVDNTEVNEQLYRFLIKNYHIYYYAFNAKNRLAFLPNYKNYYLEKAPYEEVSKRYSVHRRRNVRPHDKQNKDLVFAKETPQELSAYKSFFMTYAKGYGGRGKRDVRMKSLYHTVLERFHHAGFLEVYTVKHKSKLVSVAYILVSGEEKYLVGFVNASQPRTNASSFIIDQILRTSIASYRFSFQGSNVPSVEDFYKRFGGVLSYYPYVRRSKLKLLLSYLRPL